MTVARRASDERWSVPVFGRGWTPTLVAVLLAGPGCANGRSISVQGGHERGAVRSAYRGGADAGWRIYRNLPNCYSLRYPREAVPDTADADSVSFRMTHWARLGDGPDSLHVEYVFTILVSTNPDGLQPKEWAGQMVSADSSMNDVNPEEMFRDHGAIRIGTLDGYRLLLAGFDEAAEVVYLGANARMYELSFPTARPESQSDLDTYLPIFDGMLQSFAPTRSSECRGSRSRGSK